MRKLTFSSLLTLALLMGYGCDSKKSTDTNTEETTSASTGADSEAGAAADTMASTTATPTNQQANDFILKAASGGMMEVEVGKMAQEKGVDADVKAFGQKMVEDHGKANAELKALAASKNVTLPVAPIEEQQKHIEAMRAMKGVAFDKHYMGMMVNDHNKDIAEFEKASQNEDADVKAFASKTLPVLKGHLDLAQKTNAKVSK